MYNVFCDFVTNSYLSPQKRKVLKLLDENGEFLDNISGKEIVSISQSDNIIFSEVYDLGKITKKEDSIRLHIESVLNSNLKGKLIKLNKHYC